MNPRTPSFVNVKYEKKPCRSPILIFMKTKMSIFSCVVLVSHHQIVFNVLFKSLGSVWKMEGGT